MKVISWIGVVVVCFLSFASLGYAGVLNKAESVGQIINNFSPKTGGCWFHEGGEYKVSNQISLYDFNVDMEGEALGIGSVDLGYAGERRFFISPMIDVKILDVFKLDVPLLGYFNVSFGPAISKDFSEGLDDWSLDDFDYGFTTVGFNWKIPLGE